MKEILLPLLAIPALSLILMSYTPWWTIVLIAAIVCWFVSRRAIAAFAVAFVAGALSWGLSAWWQDQSHYHSVADLLSDMGLGRPSTAYLATALVGGLLSGLAGAMAVSLRALTLSKS